MRNLLNYVIPQCTQALSSLTALEMGCKTHTLFYSVISGQSDLFKPRRIIILESLFSPSSHKVQYMYGSITKLINCTRLRPHIGMLIQYMYMYVETQTDLFHKLFSSSAPSSAAENQTFLK